MWFLYLSKFHSSLETEAAIYAYCRLKHAAEKVLETRIGQCHSLDGLCDRNHLQYVRQIDAGGERGRKTRYEKATEH